MVIVPQDKRNLCLEKKRGEKKRKRKRRMDKEEKCGKREENAEGS